MKIAVVYNRQSQRVINLLGTPNREKYGKQAIDRVVRSLRQGGHQVMALEGDRDLIDKLEDFMPRVVAGERPGMVFNLAYGIQGQARYTHVPGILEMVGIPYVGSGPMAHSLALDKVVAKSIFLQHGVPTPAFYVLEGPDDPLPDDLAWPMIVKPRNEAVSFGIAIVNDEAELRAAAGRIFEAFNQPVLVEQYVDGREINVGLLGNGSPEALPPAEIVFGEGGPKIYTYEDKKRSSGREVRVECPAVLSPEQAEQARDVAVRAFRSLGCFDCARVDMRLDADGNFWVLEINSLPSLGEHGSFVQGAEAAGMNFAALVNRLVDVAAARYFGVPHPPEITNGDKDLGHVLFGQITERRDRLERTIRDWVGVQSRTADPIGIRGACDKLDQAMRKLDFAQVPELTDDPEVTTWQSPAGLDDGTLLIAQLDVPLASDVVPAAFRRDPELLHGEAIASSRAPLAIMLHALQSLRSARRLRGTKLGILAFTDEGQDCAFSSPLITAAARRCKRVLVLRPGSRDGRLITERRGMRRYRLTVSGDPRRLGHASRRPEVARWVWQRLEEAAALSSRPDRVAVSVGEIQTRAFRMLLPHEVVVSIVTSFPDVTAGDALEQRLRSVLGANSGGVRWELERTADRPPMRARRANRELAKQLQGIAGRWEIPLGEDSSLLPSVAGLVPEGTPVVCGIGPVADQPFTASEAVQRISVVQKAVLLAQFLASEEVQ